MCTGSKPKVDNSVQEQMLEESRLAREAEEARQARINQGSAQIEAMFNGGKVAVADPTASAAAKAANQKAYDNWVAQQKAAYAAQPASAAPAWTAFSDESGQADSTPDRNPASTKSAFTLGALPKGIYDPATYDPKVTKTKTYTGFGDDYFNDFRDAQIGLYQPELDDKYDDATSALTFALARAGTLNSSIAADKQSDLLQSYDEQRGQILSGADQATADLRSRVNDEKSAVLSQLNATGDATRAASEAMSRMSAIKATQPSYNPLGDIFAGAATGVGSYLAGQQNQAIRNAYFGTGTTGTGASDGRIVR